MFLSRFKLTAGNTTFTLTYVIALAVVAGLSIATHVILGIVISDQREVAQIVNRPGRQRMLSQRIAWLAPHYAETGDPATRVHLRNTITEMGEAARRLRNGGSKSDTPSSLPPSIAKIYREEDVTRRVDAYLFHAQAVADTDIPAGTGMRTRNGPTLEHLSAILTEASEPILTTLDNIVRQYVAESDVRIEKLQSSQQITLIIVILTLTAEALFIFRPLASGILAAVERMKELSRRATDAQRASAAKSSFLAHMSHELRTPMTGIIVMTDLLLNSPQSPEQEKMTRLLRQSAQNLHDLLNDILDLAKIEAGSITLESVDFSLSDLLTSVRELFAHTMQAKGLAFVFETPETPIDVFRGDPKHLRQVLYNLVSNALKFTNAGYVRVKCWQENADAGQATLKFSVTDSGIGISQDNIERLFGKFEQEDSSTARRFGGTGLGLAICKQLTEAMGGGIEVHSTKGSGSVFTFSVRVKRGDPAKVGQNTAGASLQAGRDPENPNLNILVVDDNPTTQFLIREVLAFWGHTVTGADSGHEAFERILVDNFDVILLDIQMPELNGEQTARLIRANGGTSATTPIIAVTADAVVGNHKRYFAAGCSSVVTKPISWDHLAKEIQALGGKTAKARAAATDVVAISVA